MWDPERYYLKAKVYMQKANEYGQDRWEHPFWCSLSLELLARAALTKVHPVLNADPQNEGKHIMHALGFNIIAQPKSIPIHSVIARLEKIIDDFGDTHKTFCEYFFVIRSQELHSSELSCEGLNPARWQARFYDTCKILCEYVSKSLKDYLGEDIEKVAIQMIATAKSDKIGKVKKKIHEHKVVFENKPPGEQENLKREFESRSKDWENEYTRNNCPACDCFARLKGDYIKDSAPVYQDDDFYVERLYLAKEFECFACDLKLSDLEEIQIAEVDPSFSQKISTSLHELFEPEYEMEYENM